jgi:hypothetical protein
MPIHTNRLKTIFRAILILVALVITYLIFLVVRPDEALRPEVAAFYAETKMAIPVVPDEKNARIGLLGINAPATENFIAVGKKIKQIYSERENWSDANARVRTLTSNDTIKSQLSATSEAVDCWINRDENSPGITRQQTPTCASPAQLADILQTNVAYQRYLQIQKMAVAPVDAPAQFQPLITLNKLSYAAVLLDLENNQYEAAYQKWRDNFVFLAKLTKQNEDLIGVAVNLVNEGLNFAALDDLLHIAPTLAITHRDELTALLAPVSIAHYNIPNIIRGEGRFVQNGVDSYWAEKYPLQERVVKTLSRPNYLANRHYQYSQPLLKAATLPPLEMQAAFDSQLSKSTFAIDPFDPANSALLRYHASAQSKFGSLLMSMHAKLAQRKLNTLRLDIIQNKLSDADIEAFVQQAPAELRNPFDNQPMRWNAKTRTLYAPVAGREYAPSVRL